MVENVNSLFKSKGFGKLPDQGLIPRPFTKQQVRPHVTSGILPNLSDLKFFSYLF